MEICLLETFCNRERYYHQDIFQVGLEFELKKIDKEKYKIHKAFQSLAKNKRIPAGQCRCLTLFQALKNRRQTS